MGFSNKTHSAVHFLKVKGLEKASGKHYFEVDGEQIEQNVFHGRLTKIQASSYEFEGKEKDTIKMLFVDDTAENYQMDISFSSISRGLLNSILGYIDDKKKAGATKWKLDLELSLYMNKENYKQLGVYINSERGKWRLSYDEQKKLIETITNSKWEFVSNDFSALNDFLKVWIQEISEYIEINDFVEEKPKENFATNDEINVEDLPF